MSAYFIASFAITNEDAYQKYLKQVGKILVDHRAEVLVADYASEALEGAPPPVTVVLRFESKEAARGWYESPEYQAIVHHRHENSEGIGVLCEGFAPGT